MQKTELNSIIKDCDTLLANNADFLAVYNSFPDEFVLYEHIEKYIQLVQFAHIDPETNRFDYSQYKQHLRQVFNVNPDDKTNRIYLLDRTNPEISYFWQNDTHIKILRFCSTAYQLTAEPHYDKKHIIIQMDGIILFDENKYFERVL